MRDSRWKTLYRAGAVAALVALALYCSQLLILIAGEPYPTTSEGWFALFQRSKLLGLWYLNALDIVSIALLGIMFLAIYVALRRIRPSWMLMALYFAVLGVMVFIVPRALTLTVVPLSDLHAAATTEAERAAYVAAWEALSHVTTATPQTLGWLLMAVAGLIISLVVVRSGMQSRPFGKATGFVGIAGSVAAFGNYAGWIFAPALAAVLMPFNGLLWLAWWVMMSVGLFRLANATRDHEKDSSVG
jgi:hypothetical protein